MYFDLQPFSTLNLSAPSMSSTWTSLCGDLFNMDYMPVSNGISFTALRGYNNIFNSTDSNMSIFNIKNTGMGNMFPLFSLDTSMFRFNPLKTNSSTPSSSKKKAESTENNNTKETKSESIASNASGIKTQSLDVKQLYKTIGLDKAGLDYKVFANAMVGYNKLKAQGKTNGYLGIFDITQDRNKERYYLIDLKNNKIVGRSVVKEGSNDCTNNVARANSNGSHSTLPGFFRVGEEHTNSHYPSNGKRRPAKFIEGLESGINNNARSKSVIIHPVLPGQQTTYGCLGFAPTNSDTFADNEKKMRNLFPKGTIIFTCPKGGSDYWKKSNLC